MCFLLRFSKKDYPQYVECNSGKYTLAKILKQLSTVYIHERQRI